jgi:hypothetical protein
LIRTVPSSGIVDLTRVARRWRLYPGDELSVSFYTWTLLRVGPDDSYPHFFKNLKLRARRRAPLRLERRFCVADPAPDARAQQTPCAATCPAQAHLQFFDHCQGAGELFPAPRFSAAARPAAGGGVHVTSLRVADLPRRPPLSAPTVVVYCTGRGCSFGARLFAGAQTKRGSLDIKSIAQRPLRPGAVIEVQVVKGNFIGRVRRYAVTRTGLAPSSLCLYPTDLSPRRCRPVASARPVWSA